jgi:hypothetical protein
MVLQAKYPKMMSLNRLIEARMAKLYSVRKLPLSKYIKAEKVAKFLRIADDNLIPYLANSVNIHAVWLVPTGEVLIHPDGFFDSLSDKMQREIRRELKLHPGPVLEAMALDEGNPH